MTTNGLRTIRLSIHFGSEAVVRELDLAVAENEIHGLAGESGAGKSTTALAIMGLAERIGGIVTGEVWFDSQRLDALSEGERRAFRGTKIAMVFQNAHGALNPVLRVGDQLVEVLRAHGAVGEAEIKARSRALLEDVQLPTERSFLRLYPHQLSGGMAQRLLIAMAIAHTPKLLVADEPTSALDVTTQAEIIRLFRKLRDKRGFSMLFISHDLALLGEICDTLTILRQGRVVETGPVSEILRTPREPYTRALIDAVPRLPIP